MELKYKNLLSPVENTSKQVVPVILHRNMMDRQIHAIATFSVRYHKSKMSITTDDGWDKCKVG